jgi:hypothetical protein
MDAIAKNSEQTGDIFKTWFEAPETAKYRFYQACDDRCKLTLGKNPDDTKDVTLLISGYYSSNRMYWRNYHD